MRQTLTSINGALDIESGTIRLYNRTGSTLAKGKVVQVDLALASDEATTNSGSTSASGKRNAIAPADALSARILAVLLDDSVADNAEGTFQVQGECDALVIRSTGNIAAGDVLGVTTAGNLSGEVSAKAGLYGIALAPLTAPTTATLVRVLFNGLGGFGSRVDAIT